ncbi:MAG TPA: RNA-binding transcriptional accessory protein [Firmicutes bacterium]|nr:RNA-binding transcriptional accessory protein [Bacillota bacterium]
MDSEIIFLVSQKLEINEKSVQTALRLIEEGGTIPFIARYRKEETGNLSDVQITSIVKEYKQISNFLARKKTILSEIESQGKLTDELKEKIENCETLSALEDIYLPYKPKKATRGSKAKEAGLEKLSKEILEEKDLNLSLYIKKDTPYSDEEKVLQGALDIIAEDISCDTDIRTFLKSSMLKNGYIKTSLVDESKDPHKKYQTYYDTSLLIKSIKTHQFLAINRASNEGVIKYKFLFDDEVYKLKIYDKFYKDDHRYKDYLEKTVEDSYERLIKPSISNYLSSYLFDLAQEESLVTFSSSLTDILMKPPYKANRIMGFDPGYHHGCKLVVIDGNGNVLYTGVIYPTITEKAKENFLKPFIKVLKDYKVEIIALGNGTATREAEDFIVEALKEVPTCNYEVVSEDGASIYSVTKVAQEEFPTFDPNLRSSVSIARRLLDPLSELVKVEPSGLGVGQYQHDLDEKKLKESLSDVVYKVVNDVGVNVNTASKSLLSYVSGVNKTLANNIVEHIKSNGAIKNRSQLKKVKGFGDKAFENAAGFLRIDGNEPLDITSIHPESYETTYNILKSLNLSFPSDLDKIRGLGEEKWCSAAKTLKVSNELAKDIYSELIKETRDPRGEAIKLVRDNKYRTIDDLKVGTILQGTVSNVADFGCFVDIGVHISGLVHISEIANAYIAKDKIRDYVRVGQIVKVKVIALDKERERISLTMKDINN